ncbi:VWA domain-containing protein [Parahaliea mediterranea]|uniref:VWA domain-containing protein n=2 Tax=Parahaliea mediterranea TaxID=651086 RepID=A0A939INE8_9GAMM|nr:VWA domain-containing protein [Parahaliea mediterranea]MBN7797987.1 VWA domain-containing protein [Parahaliea mediterranea]
MRPEWLWALLPVALLGLALGLSGRRAGSWSNVISPALLPYLVGGTPASAPARRGRALPWLVAGWVLAVIAMTGPSLEKIPQPVHQREDALVILLDLSYSMKAADLAPSRIDRARQKILDLLARRREGQTGLVAFAGDAHVVTPLTDDNPTIANLLPALNPDMMPVPGSDAAGAVELALDLLRSGAAGSGRILLLTDAVSERQRQAIAGAVRDAGVELVVMGVGTPSGAPLPLPDGGFLKDPSGAIVVPALNEAELQQLAERAGGSYLPMQIGSDDLEALAQRTTLPGRERLSAAERRADQWEDQGYALVLLLLPLAALLFRRGLLVTALPLLLLGGPEAARAQGWDDLWLTPDQQGRRALLEGDAERAEQLFEDSAWAGTAAYEHGDFDAAARQFGRGDSADDWYNRGNALARAGELDAAIEAFRESLARQPERSDARDNLELVETLKEQQQRDQQQQQGDQAGERDQQSGGEQQQDSDSQPQEDNPQQQGGDSRQQDDGGSRPEPGEPEQSQQSPEDSQSGTEAGDEASAPREQEPQAGDDGSSAQAGEPRDGEAEQGPAAAAPDPQQAERDQALQQWLRRVPDDPSGLLREKFRYQSRQRQQQGEKPENDTYW